MMLKLLLAVTVGVVCVQGMYGSWPAAPKPLSASFLQKRELICPDRPVPDLPIGKDLPPQKFEEEDKVVVGPRVATVYYAGYKYTGEWWYTLVFADNNSVREMRENMMRKMMS